MRHPHIFLLLSSIFLLGTGACLPHGHSSSPAIVKPSGEEVLPVKRVVMFQNGVAYIERRGKFEGDELRLRVRPTQIQDILKSISSGIARGKVTFSDEDEKIVMRPEGLLDLKVTATQEENRNRFNIRISWQSEDDSEKKKKSLSVK